MNTMSSSFEKAEPFLTSAWSLQEHHATYLFSKTLTNTSEPAEETLAPSLTNACVRFDRPQEGIVVACPVQHLLGVDMGTSNGESVRDVWCRHRDLVIVYEPVDPRQLCATLMWRMHHEPAQRNPLLDSAEIVWCELVLSTQTSRIESDSHLKVVSILCGTDILCAEWKNDSWKWTENNSINAFTRALLIRHENESSTLVAVHPLDSCRLSVHKQMNPLNHKWTIRVEFCLFSSLVEKGVILRSRAMATIGPSRDDTLWATPLLDRFRLSEPVLTT